MFRALVLLAAAASVMGYMPGAAPRASRFRDEAPRRRTSAAPARAAPAAYSDKPKFEDRQIKGRLTPRLSSPSSSSSTSSYSAPAPAAAPTPASSSYSAYGDKPKFEDRQIQGRLTPRLSSPSSTSAAPSAPAPSSSRISVTSAPTSYSDKPKLEDRHIQGRLTPRLSSPSSTPSSYSAPKPAAPAPTAAVSSYSSAPVQSAYSYGDKPKFEDRPIKGRLTPRMSPPSSSSSSYSAPAAAPAPSSSSSSGAFSEYLNSSPAPQALGPNAKPVWSDRKIKGRLTPRIH